ncbi:peptide deformylase [Planctomycetales bacterium]|nr:peptide deformylase [Planctomycetales bacterium]
MKVLTYPHPVLKYPCKPIQKINNELKNIVSEMFEAMYRDEGVGLAANQVGLPLQLFVMNPTADEEQKEEEYVFINPVILKKKGKVIDNEGCLSFPGIRAEVIRSEFVDVEGINLNGEVQRFQWTDFPARIVQHETDHLNGVGFVEHLTETALLTVKEELDELLVNFEGDINRGFILPENEIYRQLREIEERFC